MFYKKASRWACRKKFKAVGGRLPEFLKFSQAL
jgi:hypothetical protein